MFAISQIGGGRTGIGFPAISGGEATISTKLRVYRFKYFDWTTRKMVDSSDFATARAIEEMGGQMLTCYLDVDARIVGPNGILIRDDTKGRGK